MSASNNSASRLSETATLDFALKYGLPAIEPTRPAKPDDKPGTPHKPDPKTGKTKPAAKPDKRRGEKAIATTDPRAVRKCLREFTPLGKKRGKVVDLKKEAAQIDINQTPLAFCFVLRSMFEISAKVYCVEHAADAPKATKSDGSDRSLVDVLRDIVKHMTKNNSDKPKVKALHGAIAELGKNEGLLSVTSMNQLIHNPRFSVEPGDISIRFFNVFPLLEEMNG